MAAVRHVEFAKIAVLVTWPISACDPSFLFQILRWSANMAPRYSQKNDFQYGVRPPSWICYDVIILHPKTAFYVPNFVLNFHGVRFRNFWNCPKFKMADGRHFENYETERHENLTQSWGRKMQFLDAIRWRHNKSKMADGRDIENRFFGYISAPYWPINAKFGTEMKDHMPI